MTTPNFIAHKIGIKLCSYIRNNNISPAYALNYISCDTIDFYNGKNGATGVTGYVTVDGYNVVVDIISNYNRPGLITITVDDETVQFENSEVSAFTTSATQWKENIAA